MHGRINIKKRYREYLKYISSKCYIEMCLITYYIKSKITEVVPNDKELRKT